MSAADRNKILIAGGVALVAILVIVFFLRGRGTKQPAAGAGGFAGPEQVAAGGQAGQQPAGGAAAPGQAAPAPPGGGVPATPGATQTAEASAAGGGPIYLPGTPLTLGTGAGEATRRDPFLTFEPEPQPIPPEVIANLPPVILQTGGLRPPGLPEAAGPLGRRRVAGLLFNDGAWAILEQDGRTFIVKPGDVVDGNRITAVGPDSIFVTDTQGRHWRVTLRAVAGAEASPAGTMLTTTVPGMPAAPPGEY